MVNFDFISPTRIIFGEGTENGGRRNLKYGKILLHYGGGSIKKTEPLR